MSRLACVLTTIQPPTDQVRRLAAALAPLGAPLFVAGDSAGPASYLDDNCRFLSIGTQRASRWKLAKVLGERHYARKNLAFLEAIASGAECLYETDDDTFPNEAWGPRDAHIEAQEVRAGEWANVYRLFTDTVTWPRGLPLDAIHDPVARGALQQVHAPIQQGLIDGNTDVDAIWRLIWSADIAFDASASSVFLPRGSWCPFNSQSTWWWADAFPLLYLPFHCSFRMTDIWRGFVAQACLWAMDARLVFHPPDSFQVRNPHDLMVDFAKEVPGYLGNRKLVAVLAGLELAPGRDAVADNLKTCYRALAAAGIFPREELQLVDAFVADLASARRAAAAPIARETGRAA
jgi:hypothetical protein